MKALYNASIFWWPAIWKAGLGCLVAMGTLFVTSADKLAWEVVSGWHWFDWVKFGVPILIGGATHVIGFLDQTMQKLRDVKDSLPPDGWKPGETI